ncbi:hypothetical protein [Streptomyces sp. NPDC060366]|uniref:hypothetical protein n=1 Tax=Streptomyces sp. NPDC060366 TaxID=3347105 RepID=UPI0036625E90
MSHNPPQGPTQPWGQPPQPFGPPPTPLTTRPRWARKRVVIPAAVILFGIGGAAGASGNTDADATAKSEPGPTVTVTVKPAAPASDEEPAPEVTVTKTVTEKPKAKPKPKVVGIPGDGTFVVGDEVKPGTYKTSGPADSAFPNCYWARLKSTTGDFEDIIANGNPQGQTTITIAGGDGAFQTSGCGEWKKTG